MKPRRLYFSSRKSGLARDFRISRRLSGSLSARLMPCCSAGSGLRAGHALHRSRRDDQRVAAIGPGDSGGAALDDDKNPVCGIRKIKFQKMKRKYPKTIALKVKRIGLLKKK